MSDIDTAAADSLKALDLERPMGVPDFRYGSGSTDWLDNCTSVVPPIASIAAIIRRVAMCQ